MYLLQGERESLLIEAGLSFSNVVKDNDVEISSILGCIITHEHGDHCKHATDVAKHGIPLYASQGTLENLKLKGYEEKYVVLVNTPFSIGDFEILAFRTLHDATEPFGFLIRHPECGTILFATDTYYLPYKFVEINHILIECNYCRHILDSNYTASIIPRVRHSRTIESHLELGSLCEILSGFDLSKVWNVVLLHLSDQNSDEEEIQERISGVVGLRPIAIARKGVRLRLTKDPF